MQRLLEILFGAYRGSGNDGVERLVDFNPPAWMGTHPRMINALLFLAAVVIVVLVYRRDGRRTGARVGLGILRVALFAFLLALINRPVVREVRTRVEPSVLALLVDDTISMTVKDVNPDGTPLTHAAGATTQRATAPLGPTTGPSDLGTLTPTRLQAVASLLSADDGAVLRRLAKVHTIHLYTFDKDAHPVMSTDPAAAVAAPGAARPAAPTTRPADAGTPPPETTVPQLVNAVRNLKPDLTNGNSTQVIPSLLTVLDNLQGQRLAGVVVITDARETPAPASPAAAEKLRRFGAKIFPVAVGSEQPPQNIELVSVRMDDSVFKDDLVSARVTVHGTGYEKGHPVKILIRDRKTHETLTVPETHRPAEKVVQLPENGTVEEELVFKPSKVGTLDAEAVAEVQPGELDDKDNVLPATVAVLDAEINVLYVDGYPRWEYRYIKNEMIREKTVNISCLLTSASPGFHQEGDDPLPFLSSDEEPTSPRHTRERTRELLSQNPKLTHGSVFPGRITRFPETMDELMKYDVVLFGDVDPRQLTDRQLQIVADFVNNKGGGFGMIAGPKWSPIAYRNTAIDAILPVNITGTAPEDPSAVYADGFRPVVTDEGKRGEASTIFRFLNDPKENEKYLREDLQPLFWFCQGITVKRGAGLVYAEHPVVTDSTGRKAPLLVLGRSGAGRTLFSAYDDSWRWRYYTGEKGFDNYWVQQLRYLARSRKLGQRRMTFAVDRPVHELGQEVKLELHVLDPVLLQQLPPQIRVDVVDDRGQAVAQVPLIRQESSNDLYRATFTATSVGQFTAKLPAIGEGQGPQQAMVEVIVPRLELSKPEVDRVMLTRLAPSDQITPLADVQRLPDLIKSAAKTIPVTSSYPLWNKWRALGIFVLLLTSEWVLRKVFGML